MLRGDSIRKLRARTFQMARYGRDEFIVFNHAGLLTGRVEQATFPNGKPRYTVTVTLTLEVPESAVVGRESEVFGEPDDGGRAA